MYSGVAPMGTRLSYTRRPTLLHFPIGSKFTPRLMSAAASSRRRHFRVFVRSVTGRCVSFAGGGRRGGRDERLDDVSVRDWSYVMTWR